MNAPDWYVPSPGENAGCLLRLPMAAHGWTEDERQWALDHIARLEGQLVEATALFNGAGDLIDAQQATIDQLQAAVDYQVAETQSWHAAWVNAERTAEYLRAGVASPVPEAPPCTTCGGRGYFFPNGEEMVCGRCPAGEAYQNGPDGGAS